MNKKFKVLLEGKVYVVEFVDIKETGFYNEDYNRIEIGTNSNYRNFISPKITNKELVTLLNLAKEYDSIFAVKVFINGDEYKYLANPYVDRSFRKHMILLNTKSDERGDSKNKIAIKIRNIPIGNKPYVYSATWSYSSHIVYEKGSCTRISDYFGEKLYDISISSYKEVSVDIYEIGKISPEGEEYTLKNIYGFLPKKKLFFCDPYGKELDENKVLHCDYIQSDLPITYGEIRKIITEKTKDIRKPSFVTFTFDGWSYYLTDGYREEPAIFGAIFCSKKDIGAIKIEHKNIVIFYSNSLYGTETNYSYMKCGNWNNCTGLNDNSVGVPIHKYMDPRLKKYYRSKNHYKW